VLGLAAYTIALCWLAVRRADGPRYPLDLQAAWHGIRETAPATVDAILRVWPVVALAVYLIARWLRRRADDLSRAEALGGAVIVLWGVAYAALITLGPTGLYRPLVLRVLLAGVVVAFLATTRSGPVRRPAPGRDRTGVRLLVLAIVLASGPLFLLQLGSPVSPFMDILPYVASVQKIVTFHFYDPFANDAAGIWAPSRQVAGSDALFSFLGIVSGVPGNLAITALLVPFCLLQIVGLFLLGRAAAGARAGGFGALFLLTTFLWRRTADGRGTAVAFVLIAFGIVFLVARRRSGMRTVLGGLALGLAVAVNPLIGACGMQVASLTLLIAWLDCDLPIVGPVIALAGASLLAFPQVLIGTGTRTNLALLPLAVAAGVLLLALAGWIAGRSTTAPEPGPTPRALPFARVLTIGALLGYVVWSHATHRTAFFGDDWFGYPVLLLLAAGGLIAGTYGVWRRPRRHPAAAVPAVAFAVGLFDHMLADPRRFAGPLEMRSLASEVTTKMVYYWTPYWAALCAGILFALLARRGRGAAIAFALLLVVYPLHHVAEPLDFDTQQLSLAENWGFNLTTASRGYFAGYPDRHWVLDKHWESVDDVLAAEIKAGRITYGTHVLTISPAIDTYEPALGLGVSIDLITPQFDPGSIWNVGGRVRGRDALPTALAARPPYILLHDDSPDQYPELAEYQQIFDSPRTRLYRRRAPA
jgi:hypothetical protein